MTLGTLYGIGVGPGDPELITLKAIKILKRVNMVFAASSTRNKHSLAVTIASDFLEKNTPLELLKFPMTKEDDVLKKAWKENVLKIMKPIREGNDVAFITLGDPLTYSTFGYVMETFREADPKIAIDVIPGITSYQAGAAAAGHILAKAEETLTVISGAMGAEQLQQAFDHSDNLVILKVYRNYKAIMNTLDQLSLKKNATLISCCGLNREEIVRDLEQRPDTVPDYFSLLLVNKQERRS